MTAPRIDVVRKNAHQLIHRISEALEHLDDLHTLGYYRHADTRAKERVTGGDPTAVGLDLDNNGDPTYRAAYTQLAHAIQHASTRIALAVDEALTHFDAGKISTRRDDTADATSAEIVTAMARQAKRTAIGEYTSAHTDVAQPLPANARKLLQIERALEELDNLRNVARKMHANGMRPDRARLTPLELTAWQTATGTTPKKSKKRR